jgi:hypothetical protein
MRQTGRKSVRTPAQEFLAEARRRTAALRRETAHFTRLAEKMARPLLAGGDICLPPVGSFSRSEFSGRAGGLMGIRWPEGPGSNKDVAFFGLPDPKGWKPQEDEAFQKQLRSRRRLFVIGRPDELEGGFRRRISGFTGGARAEEGLHALGEHRPLAPFRPFEQLVRGWLTAGELIAACTREGLMPAIWMSVWFEGSLARNTSLIKHESNRREPWLVPLFHGKEFYVPPLPAGHVAMEYLGLVDSMIETLDRQARALAQAGDWMARAHRTGKRVAATAVGHSYPQILGLPKESSNYPVRWGPTNSDLAIAAPADLGRGDVYIHLGYAPVDVGKVSAILRRGIRFIYTSPYGRPKELKDHESLLWLDLPWRPGDASVDVPGYSVRILPLSAVAHTLAYFSLLSEMAGRMGWR